MPVTTNTWLGATTGQPPLAQQPNSYLGVHKIQPIYNSTLRSAQTTASGTSAFTSSNGLWMAQSFSTAVGQTAIGYISISMAALSALGSQLAPITIGLYASSGSAPTGSALFTILGTAEYINPGPAFIAFPFPVTGLTASTQYWIVTQPQGNGTFNYEWNQSNQTSGASTSTNGTTWTAQAYGFMYAVYDQTVNAPIIGTWEDNGARWQIWYTGSLGLAGANGITAVTQYTTSQNGGYQQSFRNLNITNGILTGWS